MTTRQQSLARQRVLLVYLSEREMCPSFREIKEALEYSSLSLVRRDVAALAAAGWIRWLPNRARAIEVVRPVAAELQRQRAVDRHYAEPRPLIAHIPLARGRINEDDRINWPNRLPKLEERAS